MSNSQDNNNGTVAGTSTGSSIENSDDHNANSDTTTDDPIITILSQLSTEYQQLSHQQCQIEEWIQRLQEEENAIQLALEQTTIVPPQKPQHLQALERLEQALFQEDSDDDDDTSDSDEA